MEITLQHIGKRYNNHWILKNIDYVFESGKRYAVLGANGSGKSTLLRMIANMQNTSKGTIDYCFKNKKLDAAKVYQYLAYAAPGMSLIEELTLKEFLKFHFTFKPPLNGLSIPQIIAIMGLEHVAHHPVYTFSSGMKQRVRLTQAIFSDTPLLLLDEPCSNLDQLGVDQYTEWLNTYAQERLVLIASNDEKEYHCFAQHLLRIQDNTLFT